MNSLASQIRELVEKRLSESAKNHNDSESAKNHDDPKSAKNHDDFSEMKAAFDDLFSELTLRIFNKSATHQFAIQVCEDADIKIVTIVEYIVSVFKNCDYASWFEKLRGNFRESTFHDSMYFCQSLTVARLIKWIPDHEDVIASLCEIFDYVATSEECVFSIDGVIFSHNIVKNGLRMLCDNLRKALRHYKCMIALFAIVTADAYTDDNAIVNALLSRSDDDIREKMHANGVLQKCLNVGERVGITDYRRRCLVFASIVFILERYSAYVQLEAYTATDDARIEVFTTPANTEPSPPA